jgi:predicted RNA-binding Zn-ribbon protein involved in translation (DUF1610 family)
MGRYTYPCQGCGQQQSTEIQNGQQVTHHLCPGCEEKKVGGDKTLAAIKLHKSA